MTIQNILIFIAVSYVVFSFIAWREGKNDGFDEEKMFDLVLISFVFSAFIYFISKRVHFVNDYLFSIAWIIPVYFYTFRWKWSSFRVLDIFSIAGFFIASLSFGGIYFAKFIEQKGSEVSHFANFSEQKGNYLYLLVSLIYFILFAYFAFSRSKSVVSSLVYKSRSGYIFSIFLFVDALTFYYLKKDLPFSGLLLTLSLVNLYMKIRSDFIPLNIINSLKNRLLSKRLRLKTDAKLLDEEDPNKDTGRIYDNADEIDEAVLEDVRKIDNDVKKNLVITMQIQVRKALASLKIGRYGKCEVCGKPINIERLQAYPEATTCVEHSGHKPVRKKR